MKSFSLRQKWDKQAMVDWALPLKYKGVADELLTQVSRSSENSYCELVHPLPVRTLSSEGIALRQSVMWSQSLLSSQFPHSWRFLQKKAISTPLGVLQDMQRESARDLCFDTCYQLKSLSRDSLWPMDCSLSGSSVHGIFQARVVDWIAISFSRGSSRPRNRTQVSGTEGKRFTVWATREVWVTGEAPV